MQYTTLGRTNLRVSRTAFGALPIQRVTLEEAAYLLRKAYDHDINFFDTARGYTDSEEKMGHALADVRAKIVIATKTGAKDAATLREHLETSLRNLRTDYIDVYQYHNPDRMFTPGDDVHQAMLAAREEGKVRFIGITCHRLDIARQAAASGLYDTVQFPLSSISSKEDLQLIEDCKEHNVGLIGMKALSGGLITSARTSFAFLRQFENVVPIWGVQREWELDDVLALEANPPALDDEMWAAIEADRAALTEDFCRACGYCLPCPAKIPIPMAARMKLLLRRMPYQPYLTPEWQANMARIEDCTGCGHCTDHCPYGLDTPAMLRRNLEDYRAFLEAQTVKG
ncbi:MAG: aldo/keto reductase [Armatimonadota bacterium]